MSLRYAVSFNSWEYIDVVNLDNFGFGHRNVSLLNGRLDPRIDEIVEVLFRRPDVKYAHALASHTCCMEFTSWRVVAFPVDFLPQLFVNFLV